MLVIAGYTLYQIAWYFAIYSFIGWCVEVVYCTVTSGKIVNRGFLNGPVCPIYGFGMLAVLMLLKSWGSAAGSASILLLFFGGMILATTVELIAGWLMLKLFHARWWDYSNRPFNIGGFVCLEFSILWGLGCVGVVKLIQPMVAHFSGTFIPENWGWPILGAIYAIFLVDTIVALFTVIGLNRDLKELDTISKALSSVSNALSTGLGTGALEADRHLDEAQLQATLAKAEARDALLEARQNAAGAFAGAKSAAKGTISQATGAVAGAKEDVQTALSGARRAAAEATTAYSQSAAEKYAALEKRAAALRLDITEKVHIGGGRLLKAFPDMEHSDYRDVLNDIKARMTRKK
jgi:uncharacterized membrane protein